MGVYEELGVRRVINCRSTTTALGGSVMHPEVVKAMAEATGSAIPVRMLDVRCGKIIAAICGAESALLTTSATGGLALAAAGCAMRTTELAQYDPWKNPEGDNPDGGKIQRLVQRQLYNPSEIKGIKTEVIVPLGHETIYTICMVYAGLKPIWAGDKRRCDPKEIERLINDKTAAIFISHEELIWKHPTQPGNHQTDILSGIPPVPNAEGYKMSWEEVIEVSKKHDVPIILDAAYSIPPVENLRNIVGMGVDIACYCGGKSICGPNDAGFNVGRSDLIKLAACHRFPYHGLGRGMKIDKSEMVAMTRALQLYPKTVEENVRGANQAAEWLEVELRKLPHVKSVKRRTALVGNERSWPLVGVAIDEKGLGMNMEEVESRLQLGDPPIWVYGPKGYSRIHFYEEPGITINCQTLYQGAWKFPGNERIVLKRFKEILTSRR